MLNYKQLSDENLVQAYQNGDDVAFRELYSRYAKYLNDWATNGQLRHPYLVLEDVIAKYTDRFWQAVKTFDLTAGKPFKYWSKIYTSQCLWDLVRAEKFKSKKVDGKNVKKDKYKTISYDMLTEAKEEREPEKEFADQRTSIETMEDNDYNHGIFEYIKEIATKEYDIQVAVLLAKGYTIREISSMLEIGKSKVSTSINRIRSYAKDFQEIE